MLFDDNRNQVPFIDELRIIRAIVDELQVNTPHFDFKLVLTGLKIVGKQHVDKMLRHVIEGNCTEDKRLAELIAGFDMVNEEDYTSEISVFAEEILTTKQMVDINNSHDMPCFFHCGETHNRNGQNIHDAILLGTKRIGHGF